jgi:lysyl-tRNA synthetase class 2
MAGNENLKIRGALTRSIRRFFFERDYLEVETPLRTLAPIPEAHIDMIESEDGLLLPSPEVYMKRILARGYDRIFQIARAFRRDERGHRHLPEFTLLEWYTAHSDYMDLMEQMEALLLDVTSDLGRSQILRFAGFSVDLKPPWTRLTVKDAFERYASKNLDQALADDSYDEVMGLEIEPRLGLDKPVFLYDYPAGKASLARLKNDKPECAERVELYIGGLELANGFTELTDPVEQRRRFSAEHDLRSGLGKKNYPLPEKFLESLDAMPPCAGVALGLDRLVMVFCDASCIDDVVAFVPESI